MGNSSLESSQKQDLSIKVSWDSLNEVLKSNSTKVIRPFGDLKRLRLKTENRLIPPSSVKNETLLLPLQPCWDFGILSGLSSNRPCTCSHSLYEFMCATSLLCPPGDTFPRTRPRWLSYSYSDPWALGQGNTILLFYLRLRILTVPHSLHPGQLWVSINHHLLQIGVSLIKAERCINLWVYG